MDKSDTFDESCIASPTVTQLTHVRSVTGNHNSGI